MSQGRLDEVRCFCHCVIIIIMIIIIIVTCIQRILTKGHIAGGGRFFVGSM